jgi:hypothetical protein
MRLITALVASGLLAGCATAPPEPIVVDVPNLTLSVVGSFDRGGEIVNPAFSHDHWGDMLKSTDGEVRLAPGAGPDGSTALAHDYSASFGETYDPIVFSETDVIFSLTVEMEAATDGSHGITLELNPGDAAYVSFLVKDRNPNNFDWHVVSTMLQPNTWSQVALPFGLFMPPDGARPFDPDKPFLLQVSVPYGENAARRAFSGTTELSGTTLLDNVGYYARSSGPGPGIIAAFEDAEVGAAITVDLYESIVYVDYSTDEGEVIVTPGAQSLSMEVDHRAEGQTGTARRFEFDFSTGPGFEAYLDAGRQLVFSGRVQLALPATGGELAFAVRSDTLRYGDMDLDAAGLFSIYHEFEINPSWTDVVVPLDPGRNDDSLVLIHFRAPVPADLMDRMRTTGHLAVDMAFDQFRVR